MIRTRTHEVRLLNWTGYFGKRMAKNSELSRLCRIQVTRAKKDIIIFGMDSEDNILTIHPNVSLAQSSLDSDNPLTADINDGTKNRNPSDIGLFALIAEDFRTYDSAPFAQGFWSLFWHRFGNARMSIRPKIVRIPFSLIYKLGFKFSEWACGISIPYTVPVGRRVRIEHFGGIIVAARAIGNDVRMRQNTTIGVCSVEKIGLVPTIGDGVDIGVGVAILGDVKIGKNARIGANAVVLYDVAPDLTVVGVPARPILKGSDALNYAKSAE